MATPNPFDLTKLVAQGGLVEKPKHQSEIFTKEEWASLLKNYVKVPPEQWSELPIGIHIRYIRKDGDMRRGGFVKYVDPKGESISISTDPGQQGKRWRLPLSGVSEIWKSGIVTASATNIAQSDANEAIALLKEDIRQLKIEIQRVMHQQKRIIKSVGVNAVRLDRMEARGRP